MKIEKLTGLIAAPHTPFDARGNVAYDVIPQQVELLLKQGVKGAYVSGSTGEGVSCSVAERLQVMEAWHKASAGRLKLIIHTGALSIRDVETLGRRANELGFATSVFRQLLQAANCDAGEYCRRRGAAPTAFYYYHTRSPDQSAMVIPEQRRENPESGGIKFNNPNLYEYQNCLRGSTEYDIVYGAMNSTPGAGVGAKGLSKHLQLSGALSGNQAHSRATWRRFRRMSKFAGLDILVRHGACAASADDVHGARRDPRCRWQSSSATKPRSCANSTKSCAENSGSPPKRKISAKAPLPGSSRARKTMASRHTPRRPSANPAGGDASRRTRDTVSAVRTRREPSRANQFRCGKRQKRRHQYEDPSA